MSVERVKRVDRLDRLVVLRGAAAGLLLAVPAAVANGILAAQDDRSASLSILTLVVLVAGFAVAGFSAGHERPDDAVRHGVAAALVAVVPVQILAVLNRLDRGTGVSIASIVVTAFLAAGAGVTGATLAVRRQARRARS